MNQTQGGGETILAPPTAQGMIAMYKVWVGGFFFFLGVCCLNFVIYLFDHVVCFFGLMLGVHLTRELNWNAT